MALEEVDSRAATVAQHPVAGGARELEAVAAVLGDEILSGEESYFFRLKACLQGPFVAAPYMGVLPTPFHPTYPTYPNRGISSLITKASEPYKRQP